MNPMRFRIVLAIAVCSLAPLCGVAGAVPPDPTASGKLMYVVSGGSACKIMLWDAATLRSRLLASSEACPSRIFAIEDGSAIILINEHAIQIVGLAPGQAAAAPMATPQPDRLKSPPGNGESLGSEARNNAAGYTPAGDLVLEMSSAFPGGDSEEYLFVRRSDRWELLEDMHCAAFAHCAFKQKYNGYDVQAYRRSDRTELWDLSAKTNPYFVEESRHHTDEGTEVTATFRIGEQVSELKYLMFAGPDTGATLSSNLRFVPHEGKSVIVLDGQFDGWVQGHYLIFSGDTDDVYGTHMMDLADGKTVLDNIDIYMAAWLPSQLSK